jgi:hypothetical protein
VKRLFWSVCAFLFLYIEDLEQGKDTEIQGLADVGQMHDEFDKNDSLGACRGYDAQSNMSGIPVD